MKFGDSGSVLALGGLDCASNPCYNYLSDVYAVGGGNYFDAVPIHPYGQV